MDEQILYVAVVFIAGFIGWVIGRTTATIKSLTRDERAKNSKGE